MRFRRGSGSPARTGLSLGPSASVLFVLSRSRMSVDVALVRWSEGVGSPEVSALLAAAEALVCVS